MTTPMESLSLTPAESLMVLDPKKSNGKEMMKFTLLDLLGKQVMELETQHETKGHIIKREVEKKFIHKGQRHNIIPLKPHEQAMSFPLDSRERMEISELAQTVFEQVKGFKTYRNNYVREPLTERGVFEKQKKKKLLIPYTSYELSPTGLETLEKMKALITEGEKNFKEWMEKDKARARQFLSICGSNIFLLQTWDFETMKTWIKELSVMERSVNDPGYSYMWYDYDTLITDGDLGDFDFSVLDFDSLTRFDSFDDLGEGFDGLDAGDGDGGMD